MQIIDLQTVHKQLNNSYIPQYVVVVNIRVPKYGVKGERGQKRNTHYLRIKCVLRKQCVLRAY